MGPKIWLFLASPGSRQFDSSSQSQVLQRAAVYRCPAEHPQDSHQLVLGGPRKYAFFKKASKGEET